MDGLNHWIPACACLLQAGRNDGGVGIHLTAGPSLKKLCLNQRFLLNLIKKARGLGTIIKKLDHASASGA